MAGVSNTTSSNGGADADGVTVNFSFGFFVYSADDVKVYSVLNGVETPITTGITITINSSNIGGNVEFAVAPADAVGEILVRREVDYTQETELADLTRFKETAIEQALNTIVLQLQQVNTKADLALRYSETAGVTEFSIVDPIDGATLAFDGTTGKIKAGANSDEINAAGTNAANAAASATASATSAGQAATSATNAANSATAAANSAASADIGNINALGVGTPVAADEAVFNDISDTNTVKKSTWTSIWTMLKGIAGTWSSAQRAGETSLTSTSNSVAIDFAANNDFAHTLTENTTLANPTNVVKGQKGEIRFTQDATTARTVAYGSYFKFVGGTAPTAPTTLGSKFTLHYTVRSATEIECVLTGEYS